MLAYSTFKEAEFENRMYYNSQSLINEINYISKQSIFKVNSEKFFGRI